jgi:hypothetical protein
MRHFRLTPLDERLAYAVVALGLLAFGITAGQWIAERSRVQKEAAEVLATARSAAELQKRLREESAPAATLAKLMREPDAADVLVALTRTVPSDTWAFELDVRADSSRTYQLRINGFAPAATSFADTLERSQSFEKVRLVSATSAGLGTTRDRLQLTARWAQQ